MASGKTYNSIDRNQQLLLVEIKKGDYGGYKQSLLVNSLNEMEIDFYVCTKCNGIMRNACQIGEEQSPYCEMCTLKGEESQPMIRSRKNIPGMKVKCPLGNRGCVWKGIIGEVDSHLNECIEYVINCTNVCGVILKRSELVNHCQNECLNREANCIHCKIVMLFKELGNHSEICLEFPLLCPNECMETFLRKEMYSHIEKDCPHTLVHCTNKCGVKVKRLEVLIHCENECKHRIVNCEYCRATMLQKELENHHKLCLEFPLFCPNECLRSLIRKELRLHFEKECPNTLVACPYKEMGCEMKIKRCELQDHEKTFESKHLNIALSHHSNWVKIKEIQFQDLKDENCHLAKKLEEVKADKEGEKGKLASKMKNMEKEIYSKSKENEELSATVSNLKVELLNRDYEVKRLTTKVRNVSLSKEEKLDQRQSLNTPPTTPKFVESAEPSENRLGVHEVLYKFDDSVWNVQQGEDDASSQYFPEKEIEHVKIGFLHVYKHTKSSVLSIDENWERYLVALAYRELQFHDRASDYGVRVSDTLKISSCYRVYTHEDDDIPDKPAIPTDCVPENGFGVRAILQDYYFIADSSGDAKEWIELLKTRIKFKD